ncbi:unnamed protein product [Durusdinium trenchii]|uniref:Uncharacterized protein n=1 Tax=Durusdinium trenchii TaxID=1381693 RepID=A0ABP0J302_9DINO
MFDGACRCSCERATLGCLDGWMRLTNWELQFRQHSIYFGTSGVHSQAWRPGTPPRSVASPMEHLEPVLQERPIEGSPIGYVETTTDLEACMGCPEGFQEIERLDALQQLEDSLEEEKDGVERARELADRMSSMEPLYPEILRASTAARALRFGAWPLRRPPQLTPREATKLYGQSSLATSKDFWSHSWHGHVRWKVALLLMLYNGPAATVLGAGGALVMFVLHSWALLPGWEQAPKRVGMDVQVTLVFAPWSLLVGFIVFILVLFMWQSQRTIFLDRMCIHQTEAKTKAAGLVSMGAFLKNSEKFLLLWDDTYVSRLWCMLEFAAFLKSHGPAAEESIVIRPMITAPCMLGFVLGTVLTLAIWVSVPRLTIPILLLIFATRLVGFYLAAGALREHYRNAEILLDQLSSFSIQGTSCHCCSTGHCAESKQRCDRVIISKCIESWFGSVKDFEDIVKSSIRSMLYRQLGGKLFPYRWILASSSPILWGFMDMSSPRLRAKEWLEFWHIVILGFGWWLCFFPAVVFSTLWLARFMRARASRAWVDHLATLMVSFCITSATLLGNYYHMGAWPRIRKSR